MEWGIGAMHWGRGASATLHCQLSEPTLTETAFPLGCRRDQFNLSLDPVTALAYHDATLPQEPAKVGGAYPSAWASASASD